MVIHVVPVRPLSEASVSYFRVAESHVVSPSDIRSELVDTLRENER